MKKRNNSKNKAKNRAKTNGNRSKLINHNTLGYLDDLFHICKLGKISESKRAWIETNMLRLRESANMYEIDFASYLMNKGIKFIHQAPFILSGKIYFADFFLPEKHAIIEIDGDYHNGILQSEKDKYRDECFNGHRLKVIRIPNNAVYEINLLKIFLGTI